MVQHYNFPQNSINICFLSLYNYWEYVIECVFAVEGHIILKIWLILRILKISSAKGFIKLLFCFFPAQYYLQEHITKVSGFIYSHKSMHPTFGFHSEPLFQVFNFFSVLQMLNTFILPQQSKRGGNNLGCMDLWR
jgi:hypothetical protein